MRGRCGVYHDLATLCSMADSRRSPHPLSLTQVLTFLQCDCSSRCFVEGEWVVDAEHVILVGTSGPASASGVLEVVALCVQTSGVIADPHEILVRIAGVFREPSITEAKCSCTAGLSAKCKHTSAVLIPHTCNRGLCTGRPHLR